MHPPVRSEWRAARWVLLLVLVAVVLFAVAFGVRLSCGLGHCPGPVARQLLDLDAVGGLPRLFTTGVFVAAAVLAVRASRWAGERTRVGWLVVAAMALGLAALKVVSAHSVVEADTSPMTTLLLGLAVAVPSLALLGAAGRAWGVPGTAPVVAAFTGYALAALGLDVLTSAVEAVQDHVGALSASSLTFVEELGVALASLAVLAVVRSAVSRTGR